MRLIKPIQVWVCPKDGSHIDDDTCKYCKFFRKAQWHEGQWTIFCNYPQADKCPACGRKLTVVAYGSDYKIVGCPEHREFDTIIEIYG